MTSCNGHYLDNTPFLKPPGTVDSHIMIFQGIIQIPFDIKQSIPQRLGTARLEPGAFADDNSFRCESENGGDMLRYGDSGTFVGLVHTQNIHPENIPQMRKIFADKSRLLFRGWDFPFYSWNVVWFDVAPHMGNGDVFCVPSTGIMTAANSPDS